MIAPRLRLALAALVLAGGALFGFGLALSTMVRPEVVLSFLRFQDFGLVLVLGGAVMVTALAYQLLPRLLARPLLGGHFHHHVSRWNRDTLQGSALFGVGFSVRPFGALVFGRIGDLVGRKYTFLVTITLMGGARQSTLAVSTSVDAGSAHARSIAPSLETRTT